MKVFAPVLPVVLIVTVGLSFWVACNDAEIETPLTERDFLVLTDPNYPPFEFRDSVTGEPVGFDIDLMQLLADAHDWSVRFEARPFGEIIMALSQGEADLAISAITITPQREALVDFSDPYYLSGQTIVVPESDTVTHTPDDLAGLKVGAVQSTVADELARSWPGVMVFPYADIDSALSDLQAGQLDAVLNDYPETRYLLQYYDGLRVTGMNIDAEYYGIAARPGLDSVLSQIDSTLAILTGGHTFDSLHQEWFGHPMLGVPGVEADTAGRQGAINR